uniref:MRP1 n=1 Tax=Arundo donax TaxID=35708 RepID=A0A0A9EL52_ARUDO
MGQKRRWCAHAGGTCASHDHDGALPSLYSSRPPQPPPRRSCRSHSSPATPTTAGDLGDLVEEVAGLVRCKMHKPQERHDLVEGEIRARRRWPRGGGDDGQARGDVPGGLGVRPQHESARSGRPHGRPRPHAGTPRTTADMIRKHVKST